jgi:hypothetical protein
MQAYQEPAATLPRSPGHWEEWLHACKGGDKNTGSNFAIAGPLTEVVLLGNIALKTGKKLEWDGAALRITNDDAANGLLDRTYREGWS